MMEFIERSPNVDVEHAEYQRMLGYPRDFVMEGRALELEAMTRAWFAENGRPWFVAQEVNELRLDTNVQIDGASFSSRRLLDTLQQAEAHGAVLIAASAGPEAEQYAQQLWREEKPDEYFFLEVYASAVVEHLITMAGARLCGWAEANGMAVLPHYSPGYAEWDISEQNRLLQLMRLDGGLEALESGALRPKKSLIGVFGLTRKTENLVRLTDLVPCDRCSFASCQYRRKPYRRAVVPAPATPAYSVRAKALERWVAERLTLACKSDGTIHARFRYEGTTCTNTGRAITTMYDVTLGSQHDGYPIQEQRCAPAPGDTGHQHMCQYISDPGAMMAAITGEQPLLGQPLGDVLSWDRAQNSAGCYCDAASRAHKWGLVLETIHYALHRKGSNERLN